MSETMLICTSVAVVRTISSEECKAMKFSQFSTERSPSSIKYYDYIFFLTQANPTRALVCIYSLLDPATHILDELDTPQYQS